MPAFLGMRGTGDWGPNVRPENWRQGLLYQFPNGDMPLIGISSMMSSEATDDPVFHWFTKALPVQAADITGIYKNSTLATAYDNDNFQAGQTVYIKAVLEQVKEFVSGKTVLILKTNDHRTEVSGEVVGVNHNGASSFIAVKLDENTSAAHDITDADRILVSGNAHEEGASMPNALMYNETEYKNQTQIFRNPLEITRTALKTRLRTEEARIEAKREAFQMHGVDMEKALLRGRFSVDVGPKGKPKRKAEGLDSFVKKNAPGNVDAFHLNPNYAGKTWIEKGEEWLDWILGQVYRFGDREKLFVCGTGAISGLNRLAKAGADIQITPMANGAYGLDIRTWILPWGKGQILLHPLMSYEESESHTIRVIEPRRIRTRYVDDTFYREDDYKGSRREGADGIKEEYLSELSWEYEFPNNHGILFGVGLDNNIAESSPSSSSSPSGSGA